MAKNPNFVPDPINGRTFEKHLHLFDTEKVVHAKDDVKPLKKLLSRFGKNKITGKDRESFSTGFKVSAKCRPNFSRGHNIREENFVEGKNHIDEKGFHKTYLDLGNLEQCYKKVFGKAVEEYNSLQTRSDRKINNYLQKILEDGRRGTMKKNTKVDNSRKPVYEFIFQIGKRDNRLDTEKSKEILEKFVLEWMPKHYPNLNPVCISLHADEFTLDPVSKKRLDGSVHVHFAYIPIAHALTKEEQVKEKEIRKELEEKAKQEAISKGKSFNKKDFDKQDWQMWRVKNFGKALQNGMSLQSSMTGACAEMGFRTKGKLTAQIQMEEAVRHDLLDFAESYGIKVNREIDETREQEVSIDEYKAREDNKRVLSETIRINEETIKIAKEYIKKEELLTVRERNFERQKEFSKKQIEKEKLELEKFSNILELRNDEIDSKSFEISSIIKELEEQKKIEDERTKENEKVAEENKINSELINQKLNNFQEMEEKYNLLKSFFETKNEIDIHMKEVKNDVRNFYMDKNISWRESIDKAIDYTVKTFYNLALKFQNGLRGFNNFLQGKTSNDFRKLADDMDKNQTKTFEEYEEKWSKNQLDWQLENQKKSSVISKTISDIER